MVKERNEIRQDSGFWGLMNICVGLRELCSHGGFSNCRHKSTQDAASLHMAQIRQEPVSRRAFRQRSTMSRTRPTGVTYRFCSTEWEVVRLPAPTRLRNAVPSVATQASTEPHVQEQLDWGRPRRGLLFS